MNETKFTANEISLVALFAALSAVGGFIRVPIPYVPLTLQTLMVMYSGLFLGARLGAMSQLVYLVIGLLGLPVFAYGGGIGYVLQPTFGYLLGFIPGAYSLGKLTERKKKLSIPFLAFAIFVCILNIYFLGTLYLYANILFIQHKEISMSLAVKIGCLAPLPADLLKLVLVAATGPRLREKISIYLPAQGNSSVRLHGLVYSGHERIKNVK